MQISKRAKFGGVVLAVWAVVVVILLTAMYLKKEEPIASPYDGATLVLIGEGACASHV